MESVFHFILRQINAAFITCMYRPCFNRDCHYIWIHQKSKEMLKFSRKIRIKDIYFMRNINHSHIRKLTINSEQATRLFVFSGNFSHVRLFLS